MNKEKFVYHILPQAAWDLAQQKGNYAPSSIQTEGFIHCSMFTQVIGSANLFFKGQSDLLLLQIAADQLQATLVYENTMGGNELFPHLYGTLNLGAVIHVYTMETDNNGLFVLPKELIEL